MNKKCSNFRGKNGLNFKQKHRKAQKSILSGRFGVTHTGEREISAVSSRLPDNPGELAYMITLNLNYMYRTVFRGNFLYRSHYIFALAANFWHQAMFLME